MKAWNTRSLRLQTSALKTDRNLTTDNINSAKMRGVVVAANSGTVSIATIEPVVICKMGGASIKMLVK